jgi:hypothetical protein
VHASAAEQLGSDRPKTFTTHGRVRRTSKVCHWRSTERAAGAKGILGLHFDKW